MSKESIYYNVYNPLDPRDIKDIKKGLDGLSGVLSVSVNSERAVIAVDYDSSGVDQTQIQGRLEGMGYDVMKSGLHMGE